MRCLVTAGNTREPIDRVRDWGNIFTGNTGLSIARALSARGHAPVLTTNRQHIEQLALEASPIAAEHFTTHSELRERIGRVLQHQRIDAVFMTAAVSDYSPDGVYEIVQRTMGTDGTQQWTVRDVHQGKVSSAHPRIAVTGTPTAKLIDLFRSEWRFDGLLVKFKLEVGIGRERLIEIGRSSRVTSGADFLVANTLEMTTGESAGAYLIGENTCEWIARADPPDRLAALAVARVRAD